jgi:hypothetical protein
MATYTEIITLSKDAGFLGRLEVAVVKYAEFIVGEAANVDYHAVRIGWANTVFESGAASFVSRIALPVANDSVIQDNIDDYTDAQLQAAAEVRINRIM